MADEKTWPERAVVVCDFRENGLTPEAETWIHEVSHHHSRPAQEPNFQAVGVGCQNMLATILERCPPSPDRTLALNHVRQARMWANSAIALE